MDFNSNASIDNGSVTGGGGGGGRGGLAIGGGVGGLVVLVIALLFGFNPGMLTGGGDQQAGGEQSSVLAECHTGADVQKNKDCRWKAYMSSLGQYWKGEVQGFGAPSMRMFSGQVSTACGTASAQVGPFYCPGDKQIYIDAAYMQKLFDQLGAKGGYSAEAYVIGHEYGHHIQNLLGDLQKSHDGKTGAESNSVRTELQADCYAGVWFKWANENPDDVIENITQEDLDRVIDAAQAVGDDHIQGQQGQVQPDSWTHGSSEARKGWVKIGYESGQPGKCDTFSAKDPEHP